MRELPEVWHFVAVAVLSARDDVGECPSFGFGLFAVQEQPTVEPAAARRIEERAGNREICGTQPIEHERAGGVDPRATRIGERLRGQVMALDHAQGVEVHGPVRDERACGAVRAHGSTLRR